MTNKTFAKFLFPLGAVWALTSWASSATALLVGVVLALCFENPYVQQIKNWTHRCLALAVVGLGAGMNLNVVAKAGLHGLGYTVLGITCTFAFGFLLGRVLKIEKQVSILITAGTAICGGSAIAAVAPVIRAKPHTVSVALGTVFLLNALALVLFPWIGHQLSLSQAQFGLWSALAIHDTSSVVGATLQYGAEALQIGTTIKLARALWIVPVAFGIGFWMARQHQDVIEPGEAGVSKTKKPWFILGFLIVAAVVTWFPAAQIIGHGVEATAKHLMVLTLFFIGSGLSKETIKKVGIKPFIQGLGLWVIVASLTLLAVANNIIVAN